MTDGNVTGAGQHSGTSILVVDDQEDVARLLTMLLASHGHSVVASHSVADARERYAGIGAATLVITDVCLTDGNGVDLIAALGHPLTAVLFTSGHPRDAFEGTAAAIPSQAAFLQKPCSPMALLTVVHTLVEALP